MNIPCLRSRAYDERLGLISILYFSKANGKSSGEMPHHATDNLSDGEHGPDFWRNVCRKPGPANRKIDDEARDD